MFTLQEKKRLQAIVKEKSNIVIWLVKKEKENDDCFS